MTRSNSRAVIAGPGRALLAALVLVVLAGCAPTTSAVAVHDHVRATLAQPDGGHRWRAGSVLVVDVSALEECDRGAVFRAFDSWLAAGTLDLTVRAAEAGERANVIVREPDEPVRFRGRTRLAWDGPWVTGAVVEVVLARDGAPVSGIERKRVLVHEAGHVLGLAHSHRLSSIMHPDPPGASVDDTDRAALVFLYGAPSATDAVLAVTAAAPAPR